MHYKTIPSRLQRLHVVDSHTGGEPTRVVISGGPDLGGGSTGAKLELFRERFDSFRSAIVNEPRGSDVMVGAMLVTPLDSTCVSGVIFFNNVGFLGMCGHGAIGVVATLAYLGRIGPGEHRFETSVGIVTAKLHDDGAVSIVNVPSYRYRRAVQVRMDGNQTIVGDVAWGGNWFFLVEDHGLKLELSNIENLTDCAWRIRCALEEQGITGEGGKEIDHIELFGPASSPGARSRSFVLCPGKAYDRSPCGTGTSAKIACLADDDKLKPGEIWVQESIIGSTFDATYSRVDGYILPVIKGRAFVCCESTLIMDPADPFCWGIGAK